MTELQTILNIHSYDCSSDISTSNDEYKNDVHLKGGNLELQLTDCKSASQTVLQFSPYIDFNFNPDILWKLLAADTEEKINKSHIDLNMEDLKNVESPSDSQDYEVILSRKPGENVWKPVKRTSEGETDIRYLRKDKSDSTDFKQTFRDGLEIGDFSEGMMTGSGGRIDNKGDAELNSLVLRQFLEVPELRYNRLTVVGDEQWGTQGGIIESIIDDGLPSDNQYTVKLKLEDNETNPFKKGDILKGIFNGTFINSEGVEVTGFYSMYAWIDSDEDEPNFDLGIFRINLTGYGYKPAPQMVIARIGNLLYKENDEGETVPVYPERQRSWRISAGRGNFQFYDKVDSWEITSLNIMMHCGECKGENLPGLPKSAEGFVFWGANMYSKLGITQIDADGYEIPPIVFKGEWKSGETYTKNNQVTWKGCMYLCVVSSTTAEPTYDSGDWLMIVGDPNFIMTLTSSAGDVLLESNLNTTITAYVYKYNQDITSRILKEQWTWERDSGNKASDDIWNLDHIGYGNSLDITPSDLPGNGPRQIKFICTAYITETESVKAIVEI